MARAATPSQVAPGEGAAEYATDASDMANNANATVINVKVDPVA